jgi:hypothetical protein
MISRHDCLKSRRVDCKKFEAVKNIFSFKFRNQKSRRDDMSVSGDFQQFKRRAGLDRHVIPTGFLIATVLFSTDISSLRDFLAAHDKSRRDDSTKGCGSLRHGRHERHERHGSSIGKYLRDLLYVAGESSMVF